MQAWPHGLWALCAEDEPCRACGEEELLTAAWRERLESEPLVQAAPVLPKRLPAVLATRGGPPVLVAPQEFRHLASKHRPEEQRRLLKATLQAFTRAMVSGVCMRVLLDDGRTLLTETSLDSDLTHLVLHMANAQRPVALHAIESVCAPDDMTQEFVANQNFVDLRCTTLLLRDGQFISFVFDSVRTREFFEVSMKLLLVVKGSHRPKHRGPLPVPSPSPLPNIKPALKASRERKADVQGKAQELPEVPEPLAVAERCAARAERPDLQDGHLSPMRRPDLARTVLDIPPSVEASC